MLGIQDPLHPGRIYLLATAIPLAVFLLLLLMGYLRNLARSVRHEQRIYGLLYRLTGGDSPGRLSGVLAILGMATATVLSGIGLVRVMREYQADAGLPALLAERWGESWDWIRLDGWPGESGGLSLQLGYSIDILTALMFSMVCFIGTLIFLYSMGYMAEEGRASVVDPEVSGADAPFQRRGRFGRFYLYLSLFAFSMLHLLIANNLLQIFMSWELVGLCSYLLIGYYAERPNAARAANQAFIINRIGDVGFLIGIGIYWANFGTLHLSALRDLLAENAELLASTPLIIAGIGIFLGCAGKSAQFPLHTWLPDAMEGPTPVSALIHAATMVAAGVYLVARCVPIFPETTLLVIAYSGAITAFLAASIATVQTDIKRVLAYSTVSQLGFMMLALGIGGWVAGLLHLLTHAFFKALLFLGSGSVIHGIHHEQDLRKMGGLLPKMPVTGWTMLIGVLAICGTPLFSGWYSKDRILGDVFGFVQLEREHTPLFWLAIASVGLTAFYMFRMWCLTFVGKPRDEHLHEHAHESPFVMLVPLVLLAACSVGIAWGWPVWSIEASHLGQIVERAEPEIVHHRFEAMHEAAEEHHSTAGLLTLGITVIGAWIAYRRYSRESLPPALWETRLPIVRFLRNRWGIEWAYDRCILRPSLWLSRFLARADRRMEGNPIPGEATVDGVMSTPAVVQMWGSTWVSRWQGGQLRRYLRWLVLTTLVMLAILLSLIGTMR
ncbi:NADH-quinone oxidoreductase subunit L [Tuwongella immobilis]|uniref:NADH:quinone oxidoreductase/Mrp antiporter membrane subunit domain-containing protein n=1 Tax=Tuwongella immobilis TaxID=692036 RepID=A0A6C2YNI0_9BACT|nr:NADH-quinone oxidoreductase subunit L [Tuwongella immobilis]VIP03180.1 nadh dehydrogenase subunit l : NADH dehydrogenase I subunit L OS=uncultured prokaryote GN=HGMM_F53F08C21 PE=4 SV=1: Oxidored_q1_N: Oxidored_q1 [Tuwongella immobilis]VTS03627.1 nadh dehydrogenase subunit l : NADH dehydrogenase I subunit L OS=uncultured prokaryote GN=HGMM_F53F08C21 PE=4 SV=1: Oxidored_q1_N: Oxidored_q1 [Tuwongella immobilis]